MLNSLSFVAIVATLASCDARQLLNIEARGALATTSYVAAFPYVASVCAVTPVPSPSSIFHCKTYGTLKSPSILLDGITTSSYLACADICQADQGCISYSFNKPTSACILYNLPLTYMGLISKKASPVIYANRHCNKCVGSMSTKVTITFQGPSDTAASHVSVLQSQLSTTLAPVTSTVPRTVTTTTFLSTTATGYTSTVAPRGTAAGTVIVGYVVSYTTIAITSGLVGGTTILATATDTSVGTVEVIYPTPESCSNAGVQYAIMSNPYERGLARFDPTYAAFAADAFQTSTPSINGSTGYLEVPYQPAGGEVSVYDNPDASYSQTAILHRGYLFAKVAGEYQFSFPESDDISLLWIGDVSRNGLWTRDNANVTQLYNGSASADTQQTIIQSIELEQGDYFPFRVLWGNWLYAASLLLTITAPDGTVITNGSDTSSPYLTQFSCDGVTAPDWPDWGNEGAPAEIGRMI